jgi:aminodeoxyfutalosine synthase
VNETLARLKKAGLDSLPGGGAEILDDQIRDVICRGKESSAEYLDIHRQAHLLGIPTNCTMLFGTIESPEQRIQHLIALRELQTETNGFQCFVPYPFLPDKTRLPEAQLATTNEIIRMIAISRIVLTNIPHIKAYRMNFGMDLALIALNSGADDIDGTVGHEEIMHEAGSDANLNDDRMSLAKSITDIGAEPVQRNTIYTQFRRFRTDDDDEYGMRLPVATN